MTETMGLWAPPARGRRRYHRNKSAICSAANAGEVLPLPTRASICFTLARIVGSLRSRAFMRSSNIDHIHFVRDAMAAVTGAGAWKLRDHAWFVAFAPYDDPRYAISVLVEHGGFGASAAAPRAREIMRVALLKDPEVRKRIVVQPNYTPPPTEPGSGDFVPDLPPTPVSSSST